MGIQPGDRVFAEVNGEYFEGEALRKSCVDPEVWVIKCSQNKSETSNPCFTSCEGLYPQFLWWQLEKIEPRKYGVIMFTGNDCAKLCDLGKGSEVREMGTFEEAKAALKALRKAFPQGNYRLFNTDGSTMWIIHNLEE